MTEKVEHTRLDYRTMAESDRIGPWAIHHAPAGKIIATAEKREDAERIVLACNSYPALLAERDRLRELLVQYRRDLLHPLTPESRERRIKAIDAALKDTNQ